MKYSDLNTITFLGIGGKGSYFVAKYFLLSGKEILGYDLKESDNTKELEKLGAKINYRNPEDGESLDGDIIVYSNDLPQEIQKKIRGDNKGKEFVEVGYMYHELVKEFEKGNFSEGESDAFKESNIAPLFKIDTSKMKYVSVTGTDGKTSSCSMIYHILKEEGFKPALITTVSAKIGEEEVDTGFHTTTPTSQELYDLIKKAEAANCTHMIIESTSHGLEQGRLSGLKFDVVGYTNITNEHLDYHKTWERYVESKSLLISEHLKEDGFVILNHDDKAFEILKSLNNKHMNYSIVEESDIYAENIQEKENGLSFDAVWYGDTYKAELPILGKYNVSNFLLASGICLKLGLEMEDIVKNIKSFETVKGRMEIIKKEPFLVIVDYAHTPNSMKNVLESSRELCKNGRIIHVFGVAGHRDFYKRPEMGAISNELADITILTAEDSRLEKLSDINDAIEKGWRENGKEKELYRFDDTSNNVEIRRDAIKKGLELARSGDLVIITGKAHENSLCFGQTEYPWNDIEEVKKLLEN